VARVFREKLGATDEDVADVPHMTQLARRVLRDAFLRADMGISGVNFAVAETGSLCICTNEGNGRLTTTLPRVHVAMMGIERIVPAPEDLGVMLEVLARSATGQKLTVYSNVLTGPRRPGETDGPEELHVVLVDNGRSRVLASELAEILYCIRCGACLYACPVYQTIGGHAYGTVYSGPVGSVLTPGLHGIAAFRDLPHASSLCGACREVCPVRIDIPRMLLKLRETGVEAGESPLWVTLGMKALRWAAVEPPIFRGAGRVAAWLSRIAATDGWLSRVPGHLAPWTATRDFPAMAAETFSQRWKKRAAGRSSARARRPKSE
jgi:L-lactate dehydrogenase complex protein LldF